MTITAGSPKPMEILEMTATCRPGVSERIEARYGVSRTPTHPESSPSALLAITGHPYNVGVPARVAAGYGTERTAKHPEGHPAGCMMKRFDRCRLVALLAGVLLAAPLPVVRAGEMVIYGVEEASPVTLMISTSPTTLDTHGIPQPALGRWLAHIADKAQVRLTIRPFTGTVRLEDRMREPDTCALGYARLPSREDTVHWLYEVKRDRMVFVTRQADNFSGTLADLLKLAGGKLAAPSGVYRTILENRGIRHTVIDDQRQLARMVDAGDPRFGLLIGGSLASPEIKALNLRVVAELPEQGFWLACSRDMPDAVLERIGTTLHSPASEQLHRETMTTLLPALATDP